MKERVIELINQIGNSLDSPYYAEKILTECGKEILQIVGNLEEQIEILKRKRKQESMRETEEICKWKTNSVFPETINNPHVAERENISTAKYCPCCGKKIKIVN